MLRFLALIPLFLLFGLLFFVFWIIMLVDSATRKFKEDSEKIVWVIVIVFTGIIGALIYYFVVYIKNNSLKWFWITLLILAIVIAILAGILIFL
jgi:cytochrome bd-type quinol oxidase subunit 2